MVIYKEDEIEQRSEKWHKLRWWKVGGTSSKALYNGKPIKSLPIFSEILGQFIEEFEPPDGFINDQMQRGVDLEPEAFEVYSEHSGINFKNVGYITHDNLRHSGASPDGLAKNRKYGFEVLETKCPSLKVHLQWVLEGVIPKDHLPQLINYFVQDNAVGRVHFVSYRPENKIVPLLGNNFCKRI